MIKYRLSTVVLCRNELMERGLVDVERTAIQ